MEITRHITAEEFDHFVDLPQNIDRLFELIGGEIVEVPSNPYSSKIASRINRYLDTFVEEHDLGHVTGEAGGYMVSGERYAPDVAYISKNRMPELPNKGYCPEPPELAVEVISPSDRDERLALKLANYLAAGTVVWVVNPIARDVAVCVPGKAVQVVKIDGVLDGGDVLPGFQLPVNKIFPETKS